MALRRGICREHGGVFNYEAKRGRQPVRCGGERPECDKAEMQKVPLHPATPNSYTLVPANPREQITSTVRDVPGVGKVAVITGPRGTRAPAESNGKAPAASNPSLPLAMVAKAQLEAVGWAVKGKAWIDTTSATVAPAEHWAEITCSRGAETLIMRWLDREIVAQDYSMEYTKPSDNNYPSNNLGFDPSELTDRELVQRISGMKVTWWSTLASSTVSATIPGERVKIEHLFSGNGDEDSAKRVVTFVDRDSGGFRSFHVGALLKVG